MKTLDEKIEYALKSIGWISTMLIQDLTEDKDLRKKNGEDAVIIAKEIVTGYQAKAISYECLFELGLGDKKEILSKIRTIKSSLNRLCDEVYN